MNREGTATVNRHTNGNQSSRSTQIMRRIVSMNTDPLRMHQWQVHPTDFNVPCRGPPGPASWNDQQARR